MIGNRKTRDPMRRIANAFVLSVLAGLLSTISFAQGAPQPGSTPVPVGTLDNPQQIVSLSVVDASGAPFGKVVSVKKGSDGKAKRVMVALTTADGAGRVAAIRSERLAFDRTEHVLVSTFTPAQLTQLAATATTMASGVDTSASSGRVSRPLPTAGDAQTPMAH
jgi:hypothetical protein